MRALFKAIIRSIWPTMLLGGLLAAQFGGQPVLVAQAAPGPEVAQPRPLSAGVPNISLNVPAQVILGQDVSFSVTFDNAGPDTGYGPFIDIILDTTGADGVYPGTPAANAYDGLGTIPGSITATYLGTPIPAQDFFILTFNNLGQATHPFARNSSGNFTFAADSHGHLVASCNHGTTSGTNRTLITNTGHTVTFDLGTITNSDTVPHTITITYRVAVLDTLANQSGVTLANNVVMTWSSGSLSKQAPAQTIIQPILTMVKTVNQVEVDPGTPVTFTLHIQHDATASATEAYDLTLIDVMDPELIYVPGSATLVSGPTRGPTWDLGGPTVTTNAAGQTVLTFTWTNANGLPYPLDLTIQFNATVSFTPASRQFGNQANLEWTSMPGIPASYPGGPLGVQSAYHPLSTERRYEPGSPADLYTTSARVDLAIPRLPGTGFAAGQVTLLPPQPEDRQYQDLGDLWLEIPRLGIRLPIVGIPVTADGEWDLTWLGDQAGYLDGTAYPTHAGNSVLTAHVYMPDGTPGPFVDLHMLGWGDQVIVHLDGQRYIYEVRQEKVVSPDNTTVFKHEDYPWLTLITCKDYDAATDTYAHRVIVRAVLVKIEADPALSPPSSGR